MTRAAQPLYLALDQGGHASRALVLDARGEVLARELVECSTHLPEPGWVEQDGEEIVASIARAVERTTSSLGARAADIVAAGLATQRSSLVCWDRENGKPLSPVLSWQDRRAAAWLDGLRAHAASVHERTGLVLSPHYGASKMRWCLDHLPAVRAAQRDGRLAIGPLASFLCFRLLSEHPFVVDPANAARTLLFGLRALDWDQALLDLFAVPRATLPRCVPSRHEFGRLRVPGGTIPLKVVTGDQSAALYANGVPRADTAYINIGTGAFVQVATGNAPAQAPGLLASIVWHDGQVPAFVLEGTVNGAGSALAWAAGELALPDIEARLPQWLNEQGDEPPLFLNGIGGLGAPFWASGFESRFIGAGDAASRVVAVAESIVFLLRANLERMPAIARLSVGGGLARHDGLCQRLADLAGLPVHRSHEHEATVRGLVWLTAGGPNGWTMNEDDRNFPPVENGALRARYRRWRAAMESAINDAPESQR